MLEEAPDHNIRRIIRSDKKAKELAFEDIDKEIMQLIQSLEGESANEKTVQLNQIYKTVKSYPKAMMYLLKKHTTVGDEYVALRSYIQRMITKESMERS